MKKNETKEMQVSTVIGYKSIATAQTEICQMLSVFVSLEDSVGYSKYCFGELGVFEILLNSNFNLYFYFLGEGGCCFWLLFAMYFRC